MFYYSYYKLQIMIWSYILVYSVHDAKYRIVSQDIINKYEKQCFSYLLIIN